MEQEIFVTPISGYVLIEGVNGAVFVTVNYKVAILETSVPVESHTFIAHTVILKFEAIKQVSFRILNRNGIIGKGPKDIK